MAEYIEREAAIKCAEESYKMWCLAMAAADGEREINKCYKMQDVCKAIGEVFKIVPADDVDPVVHGRWVYNSNGMDWNLGAWQCSVCKCNNNNLPGNDKHNPYIFQGSNYCPNCGAKMDEEENDNV